MRYEKAEIIHRIALDMQGSAEGLTLDDIRARYSDSPVSRRTAERLRDAVDRLHSIEHANPGEFPKRWRLRGRRSVITSVTADELADLETAARVLRHDNMPVQARSVEKIAATLRAQSKGPAARIEPDLEALTEAEGLAMKPGPHPKLAANVISALRHAILATREVRLHYRYLGSGKRGFETVHPYGFLYGNRHYLVAWSGKKSGRGFRNYALANIEQVETLDSPFRRRRFSLKTYAARSFGVFQEKPFETVWRFSPEAAERASEFLFHPSQTMNRRKDGSLIVRLKAAGAQEMAWHLGMWGKHVRVLKPKDFWKLVAKMKRAGVLP